METATKPPAVTLLSTEEIRKMVDYLDEYPPYVPPPPDLPFFDVRRIAATLLYQATTLEGRELRCGSLRKELVACREWLRRHGLHTEECSIHGGGPSQTCGCGLWDLVGPSKAKGPLGR